MGFEDKAVPILHLSPLQIEVPRRPSAGNVIPPVGEQDTADVQKQTGDCRGFLHRLFFRRSDHRCHKIRASPSGTATPS